MRVLLNPNHFGRSKTNNVTIAYFPTSAFEQTKTEKHTHLLSPTSRLYIHFEKKAFRYKVQCTEHDKAEASPGKTTPGMS